MVRDYPRARNKGHGMSLSDKFEQALEKARGDMRENGLTERLDVLRDIVTQLRETGIDAGLRLAEDEEAGTPSGNISEIYPRRRFILEIDDAKFGIYFGQKSSGRSGYSSSSADKTLYVWFSYNRLASDTPGQVGATAYDILKDEGRAKLEDDLLKFTANRFAARELMPGADAKSKPANVRKTKSPVKLG